MIGGDAERHHMSLNVWHVPSNEPLYLLTLHAMILGHIADKPAKLLLILCDCLGPLNKVVKLRLP